MSAEYFQRYYPFNWYDPNYMNMLENIITMKLIPGDSLMKQVKPLYRLVQYRTKENTVPNRDKYPFHYAWIYCYDRPLQLTRDMFVWTEYVGDSEYNSIKYEEQKNISTQLKLAGINPNGYYIMIRRLPFEVYLTYGKLFYPTKIVATLIPGNPDNYNLVEVDKKLYQKRLPNIPLWNETAKKIDKFSEFPPEILSNLYKKYDEINDTEYINYAKCFTDERYLKLREEAKSKFLNEGNINAFDSIAFPEHFRQYLILGQVEYKIEDLDSEALDITLGLGFDAGNLIDTIVPSFIEDPRLDVLLKYGYLPSNPFVSISKRAWWNEIDNDVVLYIENVLDKLVSYGYKPTIEDIAVSMINPHISKTKWGNIKGNMFYEARKFILENMDLREITPEALDKIVSLPLTLEEWRQLWEKRPYLDTINLMPNPLEVISLGDLGELYAYSQEIDMVGLLRTVKDLFGLEKEDPRWLDIIKDSFKFYSNDRDHHNLIKHLKYFMTNPWNYDVDGENLMDFFVKKRDLESAMELIKIGADMNYGLLMLISLNDNLHDYMSIYTSLHPDYKDIITNLVAENIKDRSMIGDVFCELTRYFNIETIFLIKDKNLARKIYNYSSNCDPEYTEALDNYMIDKDDMLSFKNLGVTYTQDVIKLIVAKNAIKILIYTVYGQYSWLFKSLVTLQDLIPLTDNKQILDILRDVLQ